MLQINFTKLVHLWFWFHLIKIKYCARILGIFPLLATSHFNYHAEIMRTLADAGHEVTMVSPWSPRPHQNLTIINSQLGRKLNTCFEETININSYWFKNYVGLVDCDGEPDCRHVLSMEEIKSLKNYDVMFVAIFPMFECFISLARKQNIPVVGTSATRSLPFTDGYMGISRNPAISPKLFTFVNAKMSLFEKIINLLEEIPIQIVDFMGNLRIERILDEFPEYSHLNPYNFPVSLLFVNTHEIFLPQAAPTNVIHIEGISVKSAILNPLPKDLENFISEADQGVILFSLGTVATNEALPPETIGVIKKTLAKIKQRVIWKYDYDVGRISDNILQIKWVPQKEVLAHNKVIAFISHGGLNSINEAIYFGKPMISLPIFLDQHSNAAILNSFGVCICLSALKLNEMVLMEAVAEVTDNPIYRKNMEKLSRKFKDDIRSPKEKVVYWTEHVLRHKGAHYLRWVGTDVPLYQYSLIDIIGFVSVAFIFSIFLLYLSGKCISAIVSLIYFKKFKRNCLK